MSGPEPNTPTNLPRGVYEKLLSHADEQAIDQLGDPRLAALAEVDAEERHAAVAQYLEHLRAGSLAMFRGKDAAERHRRLVDRVLAALCDELGDDWQERLSLADPLRRLLAIHTRADERIDRPDTPLSRSALLTGTRLDPALAVQLKKEVASADRVDILCSFIKWSGLRLILDALRELCDQPGDDGPRLRIITTSYMGATDPKAIDALLELPRTQVRVSYDTKRTRLHAKAYMIHRDTGFGSAYVGSANLSHAALSEGLEWTPKISQYDLPHLWQKITATFDAYWNDDEFERLTVNERRKLRQAIERERHAGSADTPAVHFDLHPYPYQEEILDVFAAEREVQGKHRHLLVAATGTGKTMVAAFDYKRWSQAAHPRPSLLFIAHRQEILSQAMQTYRAVLRDQNFGDLLVGGHEPAQDRHLFCSIQSYNSRGLSRVSAEHFDYVVVDEFHHAEAASYRALLEHVRPKVLLGMTATPERGDGLDVFRWFNGEASAEIRLPDAINRRLLSPFQYFGISDAVDLSGLTWQRGGYCVDELDQIYTGNDVRAQLVVDKVVALLSDPHQARGLGFCVSIAHTEFMARFFNHCGLPAAALSADSTSHDRNAVQDRLRRREINFIFVVDLYNEGVDIPEIDTVLFLRPTESLTVYLQQLGRGLRLHEDKDCLTVLDFIGQQHRQFRFAARLRALSTEPTRRLERELEQGFPHLPAGCAIQFERVAQQRVLENIRQTLHLRRPQLVRELGELGRHLGRPPTLQQAMDYLHVELDDLLRRGLWSRLLADAGLVEPPTDQDEATLAKGLRRLAHIDDPRQIRFLLSHLRAEAHDDGPAATIERRLTMLMVSLFGGACEGQSLDEAMHRLHEANPAAYLDLLALLEYRLHTTRTRIAPLEPPVAGPLALHASYTRDEILAGLGHWTMHDRPRFTEGVLHLPEPKVDAFFVMLHKTEDAYSPTTMYEDYASATGCSIGRARAPPQPRRPPASATSTTVSRATPRCCASANTSAPPPVWPRPTTTSARPTTCVTRAAAR
ncbi:MAG: DEAD/DEAH box helicase family protein [Phycisphaeraceae bacterium]